MTAQPPAPTPAAPPSGRAAASGSTVLRLGRLAWAWVGIVAAGALVLLGLSAVAGLVVPLLAAVVLAALLVPVVDLLARRGVPRAVGAGAVLGALVVLAAAVAWLAVAAVVSQWSVVTADLRSGLQRAATWLAGQGVEISSPREIVAVAVRLLEDVASGPSTPVAGALSSVAAFAVGGCVGAFLLFLLLLDWDRLSTWVAHHLGLPAAVGKGVVDDVLVSLRRYFGALTLSSLLVSVGIAGAAALLGVPLALAIGVVTFVTSYVPYVGAIVSALFAVLIAFGDGGAVPAVALLLVVLVMQNLVQVVVQARLTGAALDLHPIVTFSATIVGASVGGVLGASLAVPVVAAGRRVAVRLRTPDDPVMARVPAAGTEPEQATPS